jgi:hypothetical protein
MYPKESIIEAYFVRQMKKAFPQAQVHKYEIRRGEPDRICLLPGGIALFVELKRPGAKPRPEQIRALDRLDRLGFTAVWLSTKKEVDLFVVELII